MFNMPFPQYTRKKRNKRECYTYLMPLHVSSSIGNSNSFNMWSTNHRFTQIYNWMCVTCHILLDKKKTKEDCGKNNNNVTFFMFYIFRGVTWCKKLARMSIRIALRFLINHHFTLDSLDIINICVYLNKSHKSLWNKKLSTKSEIQK